MIGFNISIWTNLLGGGPSPTPDDFLLLDTDNFFLLSGEQFDLLGV